MAMFSARAAKSLPVLRQYQSKQVHAIGANLRPFFSFSGGEKAPNDDEVRALFSVWNNALATGDSSTVASCYAKNAILLPTVSDTPRTSPELIKDYFDAFLKRKPQGVITDGYIRSGEGFAKDSGIYEFTMGDTGDKVKARYSFVYVKEDGKWKILHHHSSVMPEGITIGQKIEKDEVRSLFKLWNDALATGDSSKVAARYSKNAVLLPTVSDVPRNNKELIIDYFNNFLKMQPQGVIDSGDIIVGCNFAQDAGIYTFTLGASGKKVQARYSFIYVYEDGEWKISHHHSSMMPEKVVAPEAITEEQVRDLFGLWNDALATKDPKKVAARYSKDAVLLPTVSDVPRTSPELIEDYFTAFLQKKPQGKIDSGKIKIGVNWAQDAGVYTFTMGNDGSKVQGRYSFIYVFEDGDWKISHHHSSVMPEAFLNPKAPAQ